MEEAVLAFVASKFAPGMGTSREGGVATGWKDVATVQAGLPNYPDRTIAATIASCDYVHRRYGRFPGSTGPFGTVLADQAHHGDPDFSDRFYRPEALTKRLVSTRIADFPRNLDDRINPAAEEAWER